jgi:hypothetical protein
MVAGVSERRAELEASLAEMERRLRQLQADLSSVGAGPASAGAARRAAEPFAGTPAPAPRRSAPVDLAVERVEELGRRLDDLQGLRAELEEATRALRDEVAGGGDSFARDVVVDVGPFPDIATLSAFEHALGRLPSVAEAWVRSYAGDRAQVDVRLARPGDLVSEMRSALPYRFDVAAAGPSELTLTLPRPGA